MIGTPLVIDPEIQAGIAHVVAYAEANKLDVVADRLPSRFWTA